MVAPVSAADIADIEVSRAVDPERDRSIECLATAISYEAGHEPEEGQEAVAQVVINRLHDPAFPKTVCGVVYQGSERRTGCQFTFTCDGSMARWQPGGLMDTARRIATRALDGELASAIGTATNYHAYYVQPAWAARMERVARIGAHIFYRPLPGYSAPGAGQASRPASGARLPVPSESTLSVWGIRTAVLVPVGNTVQVRQP